MEEFRPKNEKLDLKVRLATIEDAEVCRQLRVEAVSGPERKNFGVTDENLEERIDAEINRDWASDLSDLLKFTVLVYAGNEAVGVGRAIEEEDQTWYLYAGYVKPKFRGGAGKKLFAGRLREIQHRGGEKVYMGVKEFNDVSIGLATSFGLKKVEKTGTKEESLYMELDDVNSPEVIKKINEVLNEG
jgi:ribosomal protein S18 acetylase RimI-like enzyme